MTSPADLNGVDDPSIPVLTERVFLTAASPDIARPPVQARPEATTPAPAADVAEQPAGGEPDATQTDAGPADPTNDELLRAAVLQQVTDRLAQQVDRAVRDLLPPAVEQAIGRLGDEVRSALRDALPDLVEQALHEELARRQGNGGST